MNSDPSNKTIAVTGANSLIGYFLLPRLSKAGFTVYAISRQQPRYVIQLQENIRWITADLEKEVPEPVITSDILIHLAPLRLLLGIQDHWREGGYCRLLAFSSTSRFVKIISSDADERQIAQGLIESEKAIVSFCKIKEVAWTLFCPTLIYGARLDNNITTITEFVRRFGFFPLFGKGSGLRQPVHADDLANACVSALGNSKTYGRTYNLCGGQTLDYRSMVESIFRALNRRSRIVSVPSLAYKPLVRLAKILPRYRFISMEMVERMNQNLCFNNDEAVSDFGYSPRAFDLGCEDV